MTLSQSYKKVCDEIHAINKNATIVAVSKGRSLEEILQVYEAGCRDFGENRVPEALEKIEKLPRDIRWHFIGHLQSNKVRKCVGAFHLIHSVDSYKIASSLSRASLETGVVTNILLEVNVSGEKSKQGFSPLECKESFGEMTALEGVKVGGLMTMAPFVEEEQVIRDCFRGLKTLRDELPIHLPILSMGMSHDYKIALQEGATHVRIGSAIFE